MCLPNILSPVFMFAFIFHCRSFFPCWPLWFFIVSQPLWIFMFFFLQNSSLLFSITRSCSFSQITSKKTRLFCCFFFLKVRAAMRFLSKWNLELHFGCHTCWLNYFTLVCLWCGRTVGRAGGRCTVTWLTEKELERVTGNKRDEFCRKKNMKIQSGGETMRNASGKQGENERQWKIKANMNTRNKIFGNHIRQFPHKK